MTTAERIAEVPQVAESRSDRMRRCLRELGVEVSGELRQLRPLHRLVNDLSPTVRQQLELRLALSNESKRRERADKRATALRDAIEGILEGPKSRQDILRALRKAFDESSVSDEWS